MLSYKTIEPHTLELLKKLTPELFLAKARLVGGTALALQYGHRMSIDLNFFGDIEEDSIAIRDILRSIGPISVYKETTNIKIYSVNGIKVDFVNYKYPWIDSVIKKDGLRLASPKEIAAMKINSIEGRGTKKDFIYMYFLLQHYTLDDILKFYAEKYPENSVFRGLMSLSYFEDAEDELMPKMFSNIQWDDMKQFILDKVATIR